METSQTNNKTQRNKKILFGCLSTIGALALIGGGIGIGYGIWHHQHKENKFVEKAIPITGEYYGFNGDKITGFSQEVIANPSLLSSFNTLDLNNKDIDGDASFSPNVFNQWECLKISLASAKFHFNSSGSSGLSVFANCYLASVIQLDLTDADFASSISTDLQNYNGDVHTAENTFGGAALYSLTTLNLSGAVFAKSEATATPGDVYTADGTFSSINFFRLTTLNLSGTVFAKSGTTTSSGDVYTAHETFIDDNFYSLTTLDLSRTVFAFGEMTDSGGVSTARGTFYHAIFHSLTTLNLSGAVFAAAHMTTNQNQSKSIDTAYSTFEQAIFFSLTTLNLSGAVFAVGEMTTSSRVVTAHNTFYHATFRSLTTLNLSGAEFAAAHMTTFSSVNTAFQTFSGAVFSSLTALDLSGAVFAVSGMTTAVYAGGNVLTAYSTFAGANFYLLTSLNLSETVFAVGEMTTSSVASISTAYLAFNSAVSRNLSSLFLPPNQVGQTWKNTFLDFDYPKTSGTIHWSEYDATTPNRPNNWTPTWFQNWDWTAQ